MSLEEKYINIFRNVHKLGNCDNAQLELILKIVEDLKIEVDSIGLGVPRWDDKLHKQYAVSFFKKDESGPKYAPKKLMHTSYFFDSTYNTKKRISPHQVDILHWVLGDMKDSLYISELTFQDFLDEYGWEIKSHRDFLEKQLTHLDFIDLAKKTRKIFTKEQLTLLEELEI